MNLHQASFPQDRFIEWLNCQLGTQNWVVGRRSKKRVKEGFEVFLTQKRYGALKSYFSKEIGEMEGDSVSAHLTEPNQTLAQQRADTKPGQAFWGGTGPAGKTCRSCTRWTGGDYMAGSGLLRDAACGKYTSMMNGAEGARVPHYAKACKYYEAGEERPIQKPARSLAAMATQAAERS